MVVVHYTSKTLCATLSCTTHRSNKIDEMFYNTKGRLQARLEGWYEDKFEGRLEGRLLGRQVGWKAGWKVSWLEGFPKCFFFFFF